MMFVHLLYQANVYCSRTFSEIANLQFWTINATNWVASGTQLQSRWLANIVVILNVSKLGS